MAKPSKPTTQPQNPAKSPPENTTAEGEALSYEAAFLRLESVLAQLESGDLPLEQSLALHEEGARLARYCAEQLNDAELRVRQWQPNDETHEFDDWAEGQGE